VHAFAQTIPPPLARRSVHTAPPGQVSPAQEYVQRPSGMLVAHSDPTEHVASAEHASPTVRVDDAVLQVPVSQTRPAPQSESNVHREGPLSFEHAHRPRAAIAAARVRIRTIPPGGPVRAVSQDTLTGAEAKDCPSSAPVVARRQMADRVLVVDDEQSLRKVLAATLQREGYEVTVCGDGEEAIAALERDGADVVVTDLVMPRMDGLTLLRKVVARHSDVPVIVVTAHGRIDSAVEAMKAGAFDFLAKPFDHGELKAIIAKAARQSDYNQRNVVPEERQEGAARRYTEIIGRGRQMQELQQMIAKVADAPSTVLIQGESGTGKELVATALHETSSRRDRPFIKINCAAIPRELVEAELFGFEKGAFTGAVQSKPGRFELADGGTLFLDEIGEIPVEMQVKLLRAVQESEFERVGGVKTTRVEVRLVAATSRDLTREIAAGRFREDLYYRLNVVPIHLPPLRERREDIPLLVEHFRQKYNLRLRKNVERIEDEALACLAAYAWPGNIRELENVLERTILFAEGPRIGAGDLPASLRKQPADPPAAEAQVAAASGPPGPLKEIVKGQVQAIERDLIVRGLEVTGGNVTRTAKLLKISRKSLQTKMKEFGLRGDDA
jgi:DNA-binding NtrC family response regulator